MRAWEAPTRRGDGERARSGRRAQRGPAVGGAGSSPAAAVEAQRELESEVGIERLEGLLFLARPGLVAGGKEREGEVEACRRVAGLEAEDTAEGRDRSGVLTQVDAREAEAEVRGHQPGLKTDRPLERLGGFARAPLL